MGNRTINYIGPGNRPTTRKDLAEHFWNGEKDKWYMGMFKPCTDEWYEAQLRYQLNERRY